MNRQRCYRLLVGLMLLGSVLLTPRSSVAGDPCCPQCRCHAPCRKVCRLVCEEKKVTVTCWGCKCEEFCAPGPSLPCREHCELVCNDCRKEGDPCSQPKRFVWTEWIPAKCGHIFTKSRLMKKTVTKTVPSYKWVVEDLCSACTQEKKQEVAAIAEDAPVPPLPAGVSESTHLILAEIQ